MALEAVTDLRPQWRWERLAEVLRDLDDLREGGERLLASARSGSAERGHRPGSPRATPARASVSAGQPDGGDPEGAEREGAVEGLERAAPQVDQPTRAGAHRDGRLGRRSG